MVSFCSHHPDGCVAEDSVLVTIDDDLPVVTVTRGMDLTCEINEVTLTATATIITSSMSGQPKRGVVVSEGLTLKVTEEGGISSALQHHHRL